MDKKERRTLYLGVFIGILLGVILIYSVLYFSLIYGLTHMPLTVGDVAFTFDIDLNETEMIDAMSKYMDNSTQVLND